MVYVNDKKFACGSCIKGHRSSSCHHADRPLFEIKRKGRPVSQCEKCRELRQSKKLHSRCTCVHKSESKGAVQPLVPASTSKTKRFIPIVPTLPNGLKDALSQTTSQPADERQTVNSLLNPCSCDSLMECRCSGPNAPPKFRIIATGLSALATAAAAMQSIPPSSSRNQDPSSGKRPISRRKESTSTESPCGCHEKAGTASLPFQLPPLLGTESSSGSSRGMPDFGIMPPIQQLTTLAGSGCTCGINCACPGCPDHKSEHVWAGKPHKRCGDGCGSCVDPTLEFSLPTTSTAGYSSKESFLDRFFARAAALPPPPENRRLSAKLNPIDTTIPNDKMVSTPNLPKLG